MDNRGVASHAAALRGSQIDPGDRVTINWNAANRNPEVFDHALAIDPWNDRASNLLWSSSIHVKSGSLLALMELRMVLEATPHLELVLGVLQQPAHYPISELCFA